MDLNLLKQKLVLGTVQLGTKYGISNTQGQTPKKEADEILKFCDDNSILWLDTAREYGNSEEVLGSFAIDNFFIISKFLITDTFPSIKKNLEKSLESLRKKTLYGYLAHDVEQLIQNVSLWNDLKILKNEGVIKKIGYSLYYPYQLEYLLDKKLIPDIVQVPFNLLDNRFEKLFPLLKEMQCEIHVRSPFLQGLFFYAPQFII